MKLPAYSSLAAFLAHYRALKSDASRGADDKNLFEEMSALIATLEPEGRAALESPADNPSTRRHRERSELHLRRALTARGILAA